MYACAAIIKASQQPGIRLHMGTGLWNDCKRIADQLGAEGLTFGIDEKLGPFVQFDKVKDGNQGA